MSPQPTAFDAYLARDDCAVFVADADGELAGVASLSIRQRLNWPTPEAFRPGPLPPVEADRGDRQLDDVSRRAIGLDEVQATTRGKRRPGLVR